ncbi:MAG: (Fe-S)-binding protein, partial [Actinobacteria bacterium]|nr:(Fe-S)-binding protein [Actinomycetota bacterium]
MPDPTTSSLLGIPGYVFLWGFALAALALFGLRAYRLVKALARGRSEPRWDHLPRRLWSTVVNVAGQRRMFANPGIGLAHLVIFWTFLFYAVSFAWNLLRGLLPFLPIPYADEVAWMAFPMEVLTVAAAVALAGAAIRRYVFTPARLERSRDATIILLLISLLLVTFLVGQGAKAAAEEGAASWSPVGGLIGGWLGGLSASAAENLFLAMWWLHITAVLGFLAYLLYSKHLHLLASPFSVFAASLEPGAMPPSSEGAGRLEEFTWRELYNGLACAECGRCDRACPAFASGGVLSPKDLVHEMKLALLAAAGRGEGRDVIAAVGAEAIWACTTCRACMERCPVFNEHIPLIVEMRRQLMI